MRKFTSVLIGCITLTIGCRPVSSSDSTVLSLDKGWTYQEVDGEHSGTATVPGTIHTDLLNNKQIENPFYRTNEKNLQWIDKKDWVYQSTFSVDKETLDKDRNVMHFYGLDTYADVYLNDKIILEANNMHREWEVDVKHLLKEGENKLKVYLHSPVKKGLELYNASPYSYPANNDQSENGGLGKKKISIFTRKAGYHYGWDWGPRFVTSGIWRPVELISWDRAKIQSVYIKQPKVTAEKAIIQAVVKVDSEAGFNGKVKISNGVEGPLFAELNIDFNKGITEVVVPFEIENPKLWWSNGLGEPNVYCFETEIIDNGQVIAKKSVTSGIRSIKLVREKDPEGESFLFELNGVRVFAKGANYIPNDSFLPRVTKSDYEKVIADAVNANMNMLRVWGGGAYEDDYFYELCDKNGIMVWQDFMFACSMYPGNEEMLENIKQEAIDNVTRLRNHPSIVLWCGNNEINTAWNYYGNGGWGWKKSYTEEQQAEMNKAYLDIFHKVLPDVVEELTDNNSYWPSSPQAGYQPEMHATDTSTSGDMHYWGVWHGLHPFEYFDKYKSRFMSEYGFQSFPDFETVKTYTSQEDYNIESEVMAAHQRSGIGNLRIKEYLSQYYHVPTDFEEFLYMSQVLQAKGIRMAIESHRRAMPYCMGSLYWQINDCWPVASWSSTDYYHKWKAVHYAVKRAFEPVILSCVENGDKTDIYVVSDLLTDKKVQINTQLMDFSGKILFEESDDLVIPNNTSTCIKSLSTNQIKGFDKTSNVLVLTLKENGKEISTKNHYFTLPKDLKLSEPKLNLMIIDKNDSTFIEITSNTLVREFYIYNELSEMITDDNYFDILPGKTKVVRVVSGLKSGVSEGVNYRYIKR